MIKASLDKEISNRCCKTVARIALILVADITLTLIIETQTKNRYTSHIMHHNGVLCK